MKIYTQEKINSTIDKYSGWIREVGSRYHIPPAVIKAVMYKEMKETDELDPLVDLAVHTGMFAKKDSSTGYMQIFGYVGLNAVNRAVRLGLTGYDKLGLVLRSGCTQMEADNEEDVRQVWEKLHTDSEANIEIAALNIHAAAEEVTGRTDFESFSPEEMKRVFTRYNSTSRTITPYGEETYGYYKKFLE